MKRHAALGMATALVWATPSARAQNVPPPPWATPPASSTAPPPAGGNASPPQATPDAGAPPAAPPGPATSGPPAPAGADAATVDVVVLRDGTELRGAVVDLQAGQSVTLRLPSGELRVVAWGEISAATGPAFRAPISAPPEAPAARATAPTPPPPTDDDDDDPLLGGVQSQAYLRPRPGTVPVRIESDGDPLTVGVIVPLPAGLNTMLYPGTGSSLGMGTSLGAGYGYGGGFGTYGGFGGSYLGPSYGGYGAYGGGYGGGYGGYAVRATGYQTLCTTPCTLHLTPGSHTLHIGGAGRRESDETIEVGTRPTRLRFRSASRTAHGLGQTFLWVGIGSAVLGTLLMIETYSRCGGGCDVTLPLGLLIGGGLGIGLGVPLVIANRTGLAEPPSTRRARRRAGLDLRVGAAALPGGAAAAVGGVF